MGFSGGASGKESAHQFRRHKKCRFDLGVRKMPWRKAWQPTPVFLSGQSHGQRFMTLYRRQGSKPSSWKRNAKKAKWLSEEALQIDVKRREVKNKGEKERYKLLNAEFQRTARRNKKPFLSDQCKEIEEKNRIGKTRDLFKKIRDTKGTFHANMGSIKDRMVWT